MSDDAKQKEEWGIGLQFFLGSRLRTPPYAVACRNYPQISSPLMVPNTQYLLDGVVWSFNDHPAWAADAWPYVQNHLRDCAERLDEAIAQIDDAIATRQRQEAAKRSRDAAATEPASDKLFKEHNYLAHAAVQDLYLAFCVIDALLKSQGELPPVGRPQDMSLHDLIEKEIPHLVGEHFPIFNYYSPENAFIAGAVEEYRTAFLGLLHSWMALRSLRPHTVRRLEEHLRFKLKNTRAEAEEAAGEAPEHGGSGETNIGAIRQSLDLILGGASAFSSGYSRRGPSKAARTPESAERMIRSFLSSIVPSTRFPQARPRCPHCGAPFKDEKSRDAHYRYHFHGHNALTTESKVVRLSYPSQEQFVEHTGDVDEKGYYPMVTELLEEAYKNGDKGIAKVRKFEEVFPQTSAPQGQTDL